MSGDTSEVMHTREATNSPWGLFPSVVITFSGSSVLRVEDDGAVGDIVADDDVPAVVRDGQPPRVEADAHLGHRLEGVEVDLEQPAVAANVVGPAVVGGIEGVAVGAVAGRHVGQQAVGVAVEDGDGARLPLGNQHQVVQVAVVGRLVGQAGLIDQHLAAGRDLVHLPLDRLGRGLAADIAHQRPDLLVGHAGRPPGRHDRARSAVLDDVKVKVVV